MYHENDPGVSADSVSCGFSVRIAGNLATCRKVAEKSGSFSVTFLKAKKNVLPIWHIEDLRTVFEDDDLQLAVKDRAGLMEKRLKERSNVELKLRRKS